MRSSQLLQSPLRIAEEEGQVLVAHADHLQQQDDLVVVLAEFHESLGADVTEGGEGQGLRVREEEAGRREGYQKRWK
jgi:hypothetical protein